MDAMRAAVEKCVKKMLSEQPHMAEDECYEMCRVKCAEEATEPEDGEDDEDEDD